MSRHSHRQSEREELDRTQSEAQHWMRDHVCRPSETKSYRFSTPGDSHYWFGLTWTPGHLTLVGDIGEMTLTHYSALQEFEPGLNWAESSDYDYLMDKSNLREQKLDRDATLASIWEMAVEPAVLQRLTQRAERGEGRRYERGCHALWAVDLEEWNYSRVGDPPRLAEYLTPPEPLEPLRCRPRMQYLGGQEFQVRDKSGRHLWDPPDGWEDIYGIWQGCSWPSSDPNMIFTSEGRQQLRDDLDSDLPENAGTNEAAELCYSVGLEGYYGEYRYSPRTIAQIEAIKKGAKMILDQLRPRRTWGSSWSDPVV